MNKFKKLWQSIMKYKKMILWFVKDSFTEYKFLIGKSLMMEFVGVSLQIATIGIVLSYQATLNRVTQITNKYLPQLFLGEELLVFFIALIVFSMYVGSSLLIYRSKTNILVLGSKYEKMCFKRVVTNVFYNNEIGQILNDTSTSFESQCVRLSKSDSRICGLIIKYMIKTIIPFITVIFAVVALFRIDFLLSVVILLPTIFYVTIAYKINIKGASAAKNMEITAKESSVFLNTQLKKFGKIPFFEKASSDNIYDEIVTNDVFDNNIKHYEKRLRVTEENMFVLNILLALCIFLVIVILNIRNSDSTFDWVRLSTYIIALRYAHTNIRSITSYVTSLNRFYTQFKRYYKFVVSNISNINDSTKIKIEANKKNLSNPIEIISNLSLNRFNVEVIIDEVIRTNNFLVDTKGNIEFVFIDSNIDYDKYTLKELVSLYLEDDICYSDFCKRTSELDYKGITDTISKDMYDNHKLSGYFNSLDKKLRSISIMSIVFNTPKQIVLIDQDLLRVFSEKKLENIFDELKSKDKIIFVLLRSSGKPYSYSDVIIDLSLGSRLYSAYEYSKLDSRTNGISNDDPLIVESDDIMF